MYRIDNATATTSLPSPAVAGPNPNSYFTKGVPGSVPATIVEQDWANAVQEEICYVIEQMGLTLDKTNRTQLLQAIRLVVQDASGTYTTSTSAANTYSATMTPAPAAYTAGMTAVIKFTNANTGAATINLNSLGAKNIKAPDSSALLSGEIAAGMIAVLIYDGTNFQLANPFLAGTAVTQGGVQNSTYNSALDTGSANTYAAILSPVPTYTTGLCCTIKIATTNTGASTLNLNSLGATNIKTVDGAALIAGMLKAGMEAQFFYDGTNFQLLNPIMSPAFQLSSYTSVADTGSANTYAAALTPALVAYATGNFCIIKIATTNTGASTLNLNSLGTKNIKTVDGADPKAGMLIAGMEAMFFYDGTNFQLLNPFSAVTQQNSTYISATDTGSANTYAAAPSPAVAAYATGNRFIIKIATTNTGASTLNLNSLGTKNIKLLDGADPQAGMLIAGMEAEFFYDGTNFQLLNPYIAPAFQSNVYTYYADSGSANAYVITPVPAITAYVAGQRFQVKIGNANTSASTLNVNSLGTKTISRADGTTLSANDLVAGQVANLVYDGSKFQIENYKSGSSGGFVQRAANMVATASSGTTTMAWSSSGVTNSAGTQFMTQAITPTNSSNILRMRAVLNLGASTSAQIVVALFQDAVSAALASVGTWVTAINHGTQVILEFSMTAGTTSSTTFKLRAGLASAGTVYFNSDTGTTGMQGGVLYSSFIVEEWTT